MAERESTHVIYKGKHYEIPGVFGPEEALMRVQNLAGAGPKISAGPPGAAGFEDTSADAAAILKKYPEPNRARDVLPRLVEFASLGSLATLPAAAVTGVASLRGLPLATKAVRVASASGTFAKEGAKFYVADKALEAAGVPTEYRYSLLALAGLTRPGENARKALKQVFNPGSVEAAAAPVAAAAPAAMPAAAPAVANEAKVAQIATARAAREAKAAEAVARAKAIAAPKPPVAADEIMLPDEAVSIVPEAKNPTGPTQEYKDMLARFERERAARLAEYDKKIAAEKAAYESEFLPPEAVSVVPETAPILPQGSRTMATNLGGTARPGPPPTPPSELEKVLQASIDAKKAGGNGKPFAGSMSKELERKPAEQMAASELDQLATTMPKGEGPGTAPWALGKRARGPGDVPQISELVDQAKGLAAGPDTPPELASQLKDWAKRAGRPSGPLRARPDSAAEPVLERKKLKLEFARILQDPRWVDSIGSHEVVNTGVQLEEKLLGRVIAGAAKRAREKAGITAPWTAEMR